MNGCSVTFLEDDAPRSDASANHFRPLPNDWDIFAIGQACHEARRVMQSLCERIELPDSILYHHATTRRSHCWINFSANVFYIRDILGNKFGDIYTAFGRHLKYAVMVDPTGSWYVELVRVLAKGFSALRLVIVLTEIIPRIIDPRDLRTLEAAYGSVPHAIDAEFKGDIFFISQPLADEFRWRGVQPPIVALGPA